MFDLWQDGGGGRHTECLHGLWTAVLHEYCRLAAGDSEACDDPFERVLARIRKGFAETLHRDDLAALAGCSPQHFSRIFRERTGQTMRDYILNLRMERVLNLLQSASLTLEEIARMSGFTDASHLNRHCRRAFGMPARRLRDRGRKVGAGVRIVSGQ